jgi:hypothetical protein
MLKLHEIIDTIIISYIIYCINILFNTLLDMSNNLEEIYSLKTRQVTVDVAAAVAPASSADYNIINDKDEFKFTVVVDSTSSDYSSLQRFLCNKYIKQYATNTKFTKLQFCDKIDSDDEHAPDSDHEDDNNYEEDDSVLQRKKLDYILPYSEHIILKYKKDNILCIVNKVSNVHGLDRSLMYLSELKISARSKSLIDRVILSACKKPTKKFKIYNYNPKNECWRSCGSVQNRKDCTLISRVQY